MKKLEFKYSHSETDDGYTDHEFGTQYDGVYATLSQSPDGTLNASLRIDTNLSAMQLSMPLDKIEVQALRDKIPKPDLCRKRDFFTTDEDSPYEGEPFVITGMIMEDVGGDHPEPRFRVFFPKLCTNGEGIPAECLFHDYDPSLP